MGKGGCRRSDAGEGRDYHSARSSPRHRTHFAGTNTHQQHFTFYYFLREGILGPNSTPIFPYSNQPLPSHALDITSPPGGDSATRSESPEEASLIQPRKSAGSKNKNTPFVLTEADKQLEGYGTDPHLTKVVDRRWYERNKHIFPASVWENFEPGKDYSKAMRRDGQGNAFFFS